MEEELEKIIFPVFLREANLSRFQKWIVAISLDINDYARFIHEELKSRKISVYEFAFAQSKFYDRLSGKFKHNQDRPEIPVTEEGWLEVYKLLDAHHNFEKESVKLTFTSLPSIGDEKTCN